MIDDPSEIRVAVVARQGQMMLGNNANANTRQNHLVQKIRSLLRVQICATFIHALSQRRNDIRVGFHQIR